jgi:hypothetical protein
MFNMSPLSAQRFSEEHGSSYYRGSGVQNKNKHPIKQTRTDPHDKERFSP